MNKNNSTSKKPKPQREASTKEMSTNKKPKPQVDAPTKEKQKLSVKRKRMGSEIDDIFARKKSMKLESASKATAEKPVKKSGSNSKSSSKTKMEKGSRSKTPKERVFTDIASKPKKKTRDGMNIYTEEELGFGKADAGGTRLCPFDCDCCF